MIEPKTNGTQCSDDKRTECPRDTCNIAHCFNGCNTGACTWAGCPGRHDKDENRVCDLKRNNCKTGLKCIKQDDGCDNDVGRCVKAGKLKIISKFD